MTKYKMTSALTARGGKLIVADCLECKTSDGFLDETPVNVQGQNLPDFKN